MNDVLFSSTTAEWETPPEVFDPLNKEFGFTLDPAASHANHKCARYFTKEDNGLAQSWCQERETVWMNPPYGRGENDSKPWIKKALDESRRGATVVCLLPARTDTAMWHDLIFPFAAEIRFLRGRVRFLSGGKRMNSATFPSAVVVFRPGGVRESSAIWRR